MTETTAAAFAPITMQDVRLHVGEGKLTASDVLAGVNAVLRTRGRTSLQKAQTTAAPPSPRVPSEEEIRLTIGGIIVGLDLTNVERARVAAGEATAAVLALFTPHQGEG